MVAAYGSGNVHKNEAGENDDKRDALYRDAAHAGVCTPSLSSSNFMYRNYTGGCAL
jgi:hypothetical protein